MKSILISAIYVFAKKVFDKELFERVETYFHRLADEEISGTQKKEWLIHWIKEETAEVRTAFIETLIQIIWLNENKDAV